MKKLTRVQRKKRRRKIFFGSILLIAIITSIIAFVFKSEVFLIDKFVVEGNYILSNEEIINTSAINSGDHILNFSKKEAEENIRNFSYIKDIQIKRRLPKTVEILVVEREAYVQFKHLSSYILVDNEGSVLEVRENKTENIPVFIGFDIDNHSIGNIMEEKSVKNIEHFLMEENEIVVSKMNEIIYEDDNNISINLIDGINVAFGPLNNVIYKLSLLNDILVHIEENGINTETILMNKGENPIIVTDE